MKKKYFRMAALVLALVMAFAGCATPEPKPGGLELTEQQLEELAERLYPDIKREDTAMWGDPITFKEILTLYTEQNEACIGYVTVMDENFKDHGYAGGGYHTYVKLRVEKVIRGNLSEGEKITTRYGGVYFSEHDMWWNVHPDTTPPLKEDTYLAVTSLAYTDRGYDYSITFKYSGLVSDIDGETYVVYKDGEFVSVYESLRHLKENEYTIKEVEIGNGETRKIALVKAEVAEQALVRAIESREFEQWEDGYIDRVTEKLKPLTDFSGDEE